ncbi:MAG: 6-phospho-beta-galactosidase [Culicoidibacterales bacterium]
MKFPEGFYFGGATAAYQAEGAVFAEGRGPCYWDPYYHQPNSQFNADIASDFYHRYEEDLALGAAHGVNAIRISLSWSRIFATGSGEVNLAGIAFYHRLIDACLAKKVEPFVTLHHFDTPLPLFAAGDWLNYETVNAFVEYARICFEAYGQKVKYWITINEPWSVVAGQYLIGHFPPNIKYDIPKAIQAMHQMMVAHGRVARLHKELKLASKIGIVHILETKYPLTATKEDLAAAQNDDTLANAFMLDACFKGAYSEKTLAIIKQIMASNDAKFVAKDAEILALIPQDTDFLGVNYYASHFCQKAEKTSFIQHNGSGNKGESVFSLRGVAKRVKHPNVPTTDWDWPIFPQGLSAMLQRIKADYPACKTIYVTENGMGAIEALDDNKTVADDNRIAYVEAHLGAIKEAITAGVNVKGYFIWSLMDMFSWTNGYNKRYGLFYVDFKTQKRYPKNSARWWKQLVEKQNEIEEEK